MSAAPRDDLDQQDDLNDIPTPVNPLGEDISHAEEAFSVYTMRLATYLTILRIRRS